MRQVYTSSDASDISQRNNPRKKYRETYTARQPSRYCSNRCRQAEYRVRQELKESHDQMERFHRQLDEYENGLVDIMRE